MHMWAEITMFYRCLFSPKAVLGLFVRLPARFELCANVSQVAAHCKSAGLLLQKGETYCCVGWLSSVYRALGMRFRRGERERERERYAWSSCLVVGLAAVEGLETWIGTWISNIGILKMEYCLSACMFIF